MEETDENSQIALAELAIADAKRTYGDDHLKVAESLEHCAQLLKSSKQRLLDAANLEAKAQLIRRRHFEQSVIANKADAHSTEASGFEPRTGQASADELKPEQASAAKTRICPYCGAAIEREAILCRFCNAGDMASAKVVSEIFSSEPDKRICPFCGGELARDTIVCWFCNAKLPPAEALPAASADKTNKKYMKPMQAALLSGLTFNGVAQIRLGQAKKGSAMILGSFVLGILTMGMSVLITAPLAAFDAFKIAEKLQNGKSVGTWEFF